MLKSIKKNNPPKALIHYSDRTLRTFNKRKGRFKVNTQGRMYALDLSRGASGSITKSIKPKCALLFTDKALEKFKPHTTKTLFGYKKFFGQYRTVQFGDVTWKKSDTTRKGKVLRIKDIEIVKIAERKRWAWQHTKVAGVKLLDWLMLYVVFVWAAMAIFNTLMKIYPDSEFPVQTLNFILDNLAWFLNLPKWTPSVILVVGILLVPLIVYLLRDSKRKLKSSSFRRDLSRHKF
ncbi:hypothetical protein PshuTeo1_50450 [Pseudomonas hunanensis]|nr:hypothetical protein PshuTeo1_50450 [Pseudomonas hunanensis]